MSSGIAFPACGGEPVILHGLRTTAFQVLDAAGQEKLARDLTDLALRFNRSGSETIVVPGDYRGVVAI